MTASSMRFQLKRGAYPFAHGARHALPSGLVLFDSYHCSRQNTNTGRLTTAMFEQVVGEAAASLRDHQQASTEPPCCRPSTRACFARLRFCLRGTSPWRGSKSRPTRSASSSSRRARWRPRSRPGTTAPPPTTTPSSILEDFSDDATQAELKGFIRDLNEDEQASLVALAWIGRGSFAPEELDEALATARAERTNRTEDYLLGMPLLPDYLEEGLDRLGYSVEDAEDDAVALTPRARAAPRRRDPPDPAPDRTRSRCGRPLTTSVSRFR